MKYAFVALALAATARAQSRDDIPKCALDCLDKGIESETSCSTTDYTCVCKNFSKVQAVATSCVIDACGADVAVNDVLPAVQALCKAIASGGGESSAAETSAAEETTSAAAETTSAAAETTSSAAAETTSAAAEPTTTSSAVEETTTLIEETTTAAAPPAATPNATTPGTAEPTETTVTGAAAALGSIGGLAMLVLAAFAL
ncbi:hypothetical protein AK830_g8741 [Neonectria ditissima]|uniref:CFEM domain-containing protein n=1 Tax=Neonectria ditissima TaxID=78410 RepID=A0A0P7BBJ5_9HYPO|nr:hypothetical protein AK830_g8741 [Neonectria ditissima]